MTRVVLPYHLRNLARVSGEVTLQASTIGEVLDALEESYPALRGTLRDPVTATRRPFVRFFACEQDLSRTSYDEPLPAAVVREDEPFLVVGAMAGG